MLCHKIDLGVFANESLSIELEIFDDEDALLDLTGHTILFVVWNSSGVESFSKSSATTSEIEILSQADNKGKALVHIDPADIATVGLFKYNVWVDTPGGAQELVIKPSRFEVLEAKRPA